MLLPQVVSTKDIVYVGGGLGNSCMLSVCTFAYNIAENTWRTLAETHTALFGMCYFNDSLITVGGLGEDGITGKLYRLSETKKWWTEFLPKMPTERFSLSVFSVNSVLVACGGGRWLEGDEDPTPCDVVEVYRHDSKTWSSAGCLPRPCAAMSSALAGNTFYMIGDTDPEELHGPIYAYFTEINNTKEGDSKSQKKLTEGDSKSQKNGDSKSHKISNMTKEGSVESRDGDTLKLEWHHFPPAPVANTSIIATESYILAIGGHTDRGTVTGIHIYIKETQEWWKLAQGDLPRGLEGCGLAVLDDTGEVMVVGGEDSAGAFTDNVFIGNLI